MPDPFPSWFSHPRAAVLWEDCRIWTVSLLLPGFQNQKKQRLISALGAWIYVGRWERLWGFWHIWVDVETGCLERINCICRQSSRDAFILTDENKCYLDAYDLYNMGRSSGQTLFAKPETFFCFYWEGIQGLSVNLGCWCNSPSSPIWFSFSKTRKFDSHLKTPIWCLKKSQKTPKPKP